MLQETVDERVVSGARFLDLAYPGWYRVIDTSMLDIDDGNACVLAQTNAALRGVMPGYASFDDYVEERLMPTDWPGYGFLSESGSDAHSLRHSWKALIERRRSQEEESLTKGAIWLDENFPGWYYHVDLNSFDMGSGLHCVLAHVDRWEREGVSGGSYYEFVARHRLVLPWLIAMGFTTGLDDDYQSLGRLTAAWRLLIEQRRAEGQQDRVVSL